MMKRSQNRVGNGFPMSVSMQAGARQLFNLDIVEDTPDLKGRLNGRHSINRYTACMND